MSKYYFLSAKGRRVTENEAQQEFKESLLSLNRSVISYDRIETVKQILIRKQNRLNQESDIKAFDISFEENKDGDIVMRGFPFADFKFISARLL